MERVDALVVGAGVVGLAVARELARSGREVIVVERAETIGTGTSSRHSEVIHAGLYYAPGSLKARLCVQGRGARVGYLQVEGDNDPARSAYRRLGFADAYAYHYRTADPAAR